jgi:hypothetical protein
MLCGYRHLMVSASSTSAGNNPTGRLVAEHPGVVRFGKAGWFAKGAVYAVAGVLALVIVGEAKGWSDSPTGAQEEASPTGALRAVAHTGGGPLLLWLLAAGLLIYAAWRLVSALLPGGQSDAKAWVTRVGYVVSCVIYVTLALTAYRLARSQPAQTDGNKKVTDFTTRAMDSTGGRVLVGLVGVIVLAVGLYQIGKGIKNDVDKELNLGGMSAERTKVTRWLGRVGEIGRGIGIGVVGVFLLLAAINYDAAEATGLDGALRRLATHSWGVAVVAVVGLGFLAYGVFCVATCTHRRLEAA